jgi:hypothetical protein
VIAARALEQFLEELITKTATITMSLQAKTLTPEHIRQHIYADPRLSFLHDVVNRMATGPNSTARSLSTSSASSTPISIARPSFQTQLSIPYQDPIPIQVPSAASSNTTNLLFINQQMNGPYTNSFCSKVKTNKRTFDLVNNDNNRDNDNDDDDDDDDAEDDDDDDDDDDDNTPGDRNQSFITNHRFT